MKHKITSFLTILLAFQLFIITAYAKPDWPADTGIQAEAGIVIDMDSGATLFGQNIHVSYPPASITKIMTALLVLEHCELDEIVTFSQTAVNSVESDSGNKTSVIAGDKLSVEDCLYSMLLVSSNQSANALAEHVAGSISGFVDMMNEKLEELGCKESHFDNPSGLNGDTQYVSAYDMAKIARAAYQNPELVKINATIRHKIAPTTNNPDGFSLKNEHRLVITEDEASEFYYPPAVAGKTGYLIAAGNTLVTYAEQDGRRLVSVILKGKPKQYFVDCKELLKFGFRNFTNFEIAQHETRYGNSDNQESVTLNGVSYQNSELMIEPDKVITLPNGSSFDDATLSIDELPAEHPYNAVAQLTYTYNERVVGSAFLLSKSIAEPTVSPTASDTGNDASNGSDAFYGADASLNADSNGTDNTSDISTDENSDEQAIPTNTSPFFGSSLFDASGSNTATIITAVLLIIILLAAAGLFWFIIQQQKEAKAAALRVEERRKRILESPDAEEFKRLMEEAQKRREQK